MGWPWETGNASAQDISKSLASKHLPYIIGSIAMLETNPGMPCCLSSSLMVFIALGTGSLKSLEVFVIRKGMKGSLVPGSSVGSVLGIEWDSACLLLVGKRPS